MVSTTTCCLSFQIVLLFKGLCFCKVHFLPGSQWEPLYSKSYHVTIILKIFQWLLNLSHNQMSSAVFSLQSLAWSMADSFSDASAITSSQFTPASFACRLFFKHIKKFLFSVLSTHCSVCLEYSQTASRLMKLAHLFQVLLHQSSCP